VVWSVERYFHTKADIRGVSKYGHREQQKKTSSYEVGLYMYATQLDQR